MKGRWCRRRGSGIRRSGGRLGPREEEGEGLRGYGCGEEDPFAGWDVVGWHLDCCDMVRMGGEGEGYMYMESLGGGGAFDSKQICKL